MKPHKFTIGQRVKTIENHECLDITKRHIGVITGIYYDEICVKFKHRFGHIAFQAYELKRVKK